VFQMMAYIRALGQTPFLLVMFGIFAFHGQPLFGSSAVVSAREQQESEIGSSGGVIKLSNLAQLYIPEGAVAKAQVRLSIMDSSVNQDGAKELRHKIHLLSGPKVQITSSSKFLKPVRLMLKIEKPDPQYANCEIQFYALNMRLGSEGENLGGLFPLGGSRCGDGGSACVTILAEYFQTEDPRGSGSSSIQLSPGYNCMGNQ
jgi:hypothetical protein